MVLSIGVGMAVVVVLSICVDVAGGIAGIVVAGIVVVVDDDNGPGYNNFGPFRRHGHVSDPYLSLFQLG